MRDTLARTGSGAAARLAVAARLRVLAGFLTMDLSGTGLRVAGLAGLRASGTTFDFIVGCRSGFFTMEAFRLEIFRAMVVTEEPYYTPALMPAKAIADKCQERCPEGRAEQVGGSNDQVADGQPCAHFRRWKHKLKQKQPQQ